MLLGIISDTHDRLPSIDAAITFFKQQGVDEIIHCGDWKSLETIQYFANRAHEATLPVRGVLGNNDIDVVSILSYLQVTPGNFKVKEGVFEFELENRKIALYHGHHKPTLRKVLAETSYDIILLGHTHKPRIEQSDSQLVINPGSTAFSIPRSKEWVASVALVDTLDFTASIHYLK